MEEGGVAEGVRLERGSNLKYLLCNYYILCAYSFIFFSIPIRFIESSGWYVACYEAP